ncbi:myo-inositol 2-dehydrogenase [Galdieria sulphuraria]|uniref:Myo-inositol 2-dehydrogenase n=1 Tax=Galdieria sulphuraria TaxID=130081 RepID=M2X2D7_GALSU|nr:myo-inositol 2-dehydrogenase [Galdieria sulphuraria]EME30545.1 myo-inositol 2-dehydrogenase [Galdieria sulphuraria]|eukprot:XP_005707065.1 myo-inositol 2-dehydrogenase [Galdieria sulphuraria]
MVRCPMIQIRFIDERMACHFNIVVEHCYQTCLFVQPNTLGYKNSIFISPCNAGIHRKRLSCDKERTVQYLLCSTHRSTSSQSSDQHNAISSLGIGVIGCGRIGRIHAKTLAQEAGVKLIGVADPIESVGRQLAEACQTRWYGDYRQMLQDPQLQAVVIGSPTSFHAEQLKYVAKAGKDIFCEKPISNDLGVIDDCLQVVEKANVRLFIGFQRRFDTNFKAIKAQVEDGSIGELRMFHIHSRDPAPPTAEYLANSGGIFLDMTSHDFDMARFITGSEIDQVFVSGNAFDDEAKQANDLDTVIIHLRMKNGSMGTIDNSRRCSYGYDQRIEVFGSKGSLLGNNISPNQVIWSNDQGLHQSRPHSFFMDRYEKAYVHIMQAFLEMLRKGMPSPVDGKDGRAPVVAALAAARSWKENRPIALSEILQKAQR